MRQLPRWFVNAARPLINTYVGAQATVVDQSQQCDGCEDDKFEQRGCSEGKATRMTQRVWDGEDDAVRAW